MQYKVVSQKSSPMFVLFRILGGAWRAWVFALPRSSVLGIEPGSYIRQTTAPSLKFISRAYACLCTTFFWGGKKKKTWEVILRKSYYYALVISAQEEIHLSILKMVICPLGNLRPMLRIHELFLLKNYIARDDEASLYLDPKRDCKIQ